MPPLVEKSQIHRLTFLCAAVYFCSYFTRINYGAVLVEIVRSEQISNAMASMALTGLFVFYGIGQVLSGYLGDKMHPKHLIFGGLIISALMNLVVPVSTNVWITTAAWCINGLAQAMMWPPLVKIMSVLLCEDDYKRTCIWVTYGSFLATIAVYAVAPACIALFNWKALFWLSAGIGGIMALIWAKSYSSIERRAQTPFVPSVQQTAASAGQEEPSKTLAFGAKKSLPLPAMSYGLLGLIMLAIVLQGILRDGITTWMPSYISDQFQLTSSASILSGIVAPLFGMACLQLAAWLNRKVITNELTCAGIFFGISLIALVLLKVAGGSSPFVAAAMLALGIGCMHGANLMLISMVPPYFARYGRTSLIAGVLNACTYIGSSISIYGVAAITEQGGWDLSVLIWLLCALAGGVVCVGCIRLWQRFVKQSDQVLQAHQNR